MTLPPLLATVKATGAAVFVGQYDINLIGIRKQAGTAGEWDDLIAAVYLDATDSWRAVYWPATTEPGLPYLHNPLRRSGCAVLVPGQYRRAYRAGLHKGRPALVQCEPVRVYRDNNRDDTIDTDAGTIERLDLSLNIHSVTSTVSDAVGSWSAGCQVLRFRHHMDELLGLLDLQMRHDHGDRLSYTLITAAV